MRKVVRKFIDLVLRRGPGGDITLCPVPVELAEEKPADWRARKLRDAAARHRRPFKCAPKDVEREVMIVPADFRVVAPDGWAPRKDEAFRLRRAA